MLGRKRANLYTSWYLNKILTQAGVTDTKTQTQINVGLNCWCFVVAIIGSFMLDVLGRRVQTLFCTVGMIVCLFLIGGLIKSMCNALSCVGSECWAN